MGLGFGVSFTCLSWSSASHSPTWNMPWSMGLSAYSPSPTQMNCSGKPLKNSVYGKTVVVGWWMMLHKTPCSFCEGWWPTAFVLQMPSNPSHLPCSSDLSVFPCCGLSLASVVIAVSWGTLFQWLSTLSVKNSFLAVSCLDISALKSCRENKLPFWMWRVEHGLIHPKEQVSPTRSYMERDGSY